MDKWAVRSHKLAAKAQEEGFFAGEILPIEAEQDDGTVKILDRDQSVRVDATLDSLTVLKSAFKECHGISAGNFSPMNSGASLMILVSKDMAWTKGVKPLATLRSIGFAGVGPTVMGGGPVPACKKALAKAEITVSDIDFWEINEAFAIVVLNWIKKLGINEPKVNIMGGGIAIGHALGATGIRVVRTLARRLNFKDARYGCATACVGGGQGVATIIEREGYHW